MSAAHSTSFDPDDSAVIEVLLRGPGDGAQPAVSRRASSRSTALRKPHQPIVLKSSRGKKLLVTIEQAGDAPGWVMPTIERMAELLALPEDWNSYGARPVDPRAAAEALRLLAKTMRSDAPAPLVIPTSAGGIQLEWHARGIDLEVEASSPGRVSVFYEDHLDHVEWEQELSSDLEPLREALASLSRRA